MESYRTHSGRGNMRKFQESVRKPMYAASNGYCQCSFFCSKKVTEFDHILPNTKPNNKRFPLFIQSPFNCMPINQSCHSQKGKIPITLAMAEVYENYLQTLKKGGNHDRKRKIEDVSKEL